MDNTRLMEIRNNLASLPILQQRLNKLDTEIRNSEESVQLLLEKYKKEMLDVEHLEKGSLSATIFKLIGMYEGKLTKEAEEMLSSKMEYDKAAARVKELYNERNELTDRITILNQEKSMFETEIKKREELIKSRIASEAFVKLKQLESEQELLSVQMVETNEAIKAAKRVIHTSGNVIKHLESAENWATFDIWTRGGIFSHMAKYNHIDEAQSESNRLLSQLKDLHKELADVQFLGFEGFAGIDSGTRVIDFWFDNIFTDLNVRSRIREDNETMRRLRSEIILIIEKLENNKAKLYNDMNDIEKRKKDLIISQ
ncbi:MAG: hypothetical protein ACOZCL_06445 [Bacillota bacterium]